MGRSVVPDPQIGVSLQALALLERPRDTLRVDLGEQPLQFADLDCATADHGRDDAVVDRSLVFEACERNSSPG